MYLSLTNCPLPLATFPLYKDQFSSVQSVVSDSLQPHESQRARPPVHHQLPGFAQTHSIESVMPSNHLILCHPLLLLPSIFPSIRVFSNESVLCIRWSKYWSFSFSISTSSEYSGLILDRKISQEKPRTENSFPSNWDLVMYQYLVLPLKIQDWGRMPHSHFLSPQMLRQLFSFLLLQDMD